MTWEKKNILVTVKAYPEKSKKYGSVVCTAGITEEGEWIRLYPLPMHLFSGKNKIGRYDWIEVECKKATEKLDRRESYKVRDGSIRIVDKYKSGDWESRRDVIIPRVAHSLESLQEAFEENRTSLGLIKPIQVIDFYKTKELQIYETGFAIQETITEEKVPVLQEVEHVFKYRFKCPGCAPEKEHNIQCEDWELLESYRRWGQRYRTPETLWNKIHYRFFTWMKQRDFHFFVGTYSQYPTWLIIGLYYPPQPEQPEENNQRTVTLDEFTEEGG